jgi:hypothetical protein
VKVAAVVVCMGLAVAAYLFSVRAASDAELRDGSSNLGPLYIIGGLVASAIFILGAVLSWAWL